MVKDVNERCGLVSLVFNGGDRSIDITLNLCKIKTHHGERYTWEAPANPSSVWNVQTEMNVHRTIAGVKDAVGSGTGKVLV